MNLSKPGMNLSKPGMNLSKPGKKHNNRVIIDIQTLISMLIEQICLVKETPDWWIHYQNLGKLIDKVIMGDIINELYRWHQI